jgi:hypothetical protein
VLEDIERRGREMLGRALDRVVDRRRHRYGLVRSPLDGHECAAGDDDKDDERTDEGHVG